MVRTIIEALVPRSNGFGASYAKTVQLYSANVDLSQ
jgi:hypothetical protein